MPTTALTVTTIGCLAANATFTLGRHFNAVCETQVLLHESNEVGPWVPSSDRATVEDAYALPKFTPIKVTLLTPDVGIFA